VDAYRITTSHRLVLLTPWHHRNSYLAFVVVSKTPDLEARQARGESVESLRFWTGLVEIYHSMSRPRRRQFYLLVILMLAGAFAELATIGAVIPFLTLLANSSALGRLPFASALFERLGAASLEQQLVAATVLFSAVVVVAGLVRLQLTRSMETFSYQLAHELLLDIQTRFLLQPFTFHVQRNTSTLISSLDKAEILVFEVLIPLMQATTAAFIALFIVGALIAVDPVTALIAAVGFSVIYVSVSALTSARLARNSGVISRGFDERLKVMQESLGGIRDVILDGSQSFYLGLLDWENGQLSRARANTAVIASTPRFIIEIIGIVAIAAIALATTQREGGFAEALPVLGAIALGAHRLLPLIQQVYRGWSSASGYLSVVGQTAALLRLPVDSGTRDRETVPPLRLREAISLANVGYTYPGRRRPALEGISFDIPAGSAVALVGATGSGKSTLADLLMGLLEPADGEIRIDGTPLKPNITRRWQRSIAHVPQAIFLADASIAGNIALAAPDDEIGLDRLVEASKTAQLHDFVMSLPDGYDTFVGERGIRLSGGQRQRLGIARAIYKNAPVLVLDEATSALDEATEAAVMDALHRVRAEGRTTIIIIAHRLSTISRCDRVVRLHEGRVSEVGSYGEVVRPRPARRGARASR